MDIAIHWGVWRNLSDDVGARAWVLVTAIILDALALLAFLVIKGGADPTIVGIAIVSIIVIFTFERFYLTQRRTE
mgnify:FL=1